jgi:hypothetical protein
MTSAGQSWYVSVSDREAIRPVFRVGPFRSSQAASDYKDLIGHLDRAGRFKVKIIVAVNSRNVSKIFWSTREG